MQTIFMTLEKNYIKYGKSRIEIIIDDNDDFWFRAIDSAKALGYKDIKDALKRHVDKEDVIALRNIDFRNTTKMHPHTLFISESGFYDLTLRSQLSTAKKFKHWLTHEVLPSIRKYGKYKLKKEYEKKHLEIIKRINNLEKENANMRRDLRKEKYPEGGIVYVIDYSEDQEIYRIGRTSNMNSRKKVYDSHTLHKHDVVYEKKTNDPIRLESCLKSMLRGKRYKNNKDFYVCSLSTIKKSFNMCLKSMREVDKDQIGGNSLGESIIYQIRLLQDKKDILERKINKLDRFLYN